MQRTPLPPALLRLFDTGGTGLHGADDPQVLREAAKSATASTIGIQHERWAL